MADNNTNQVQLAVYDLSRGMARAMSRQILGQQIEGIWHTGIVVYGQEYYFGGGVQRVRWGQFAQMNQLPPDQVLTMGVTSKSQGELENYLRGIQHQFTNATYDLINNNCNHFSNVICQFLTGHGIPTHIVDLPRIVFSTPGGAMLRPMIEGIQGNIRQQHGYGLDPFSGNTPAPQPAQSFENSLSAAVTSVAQNALLNNAVNTLTLADLEEHPLISADASSITAVAAKIFNLAGSDGVKGSALTEEEKTLLRSILSRLTENATPSFNIEDYVFMEKLLSEHPDAHMSCLLVVRLMFLHDKLSDYSRLNLVREILRRLLVPLNQPPSSSSSAVNPFASVPAHVMALCSLANLLSHDTGKAYLLGGESSIPSDGEGTSESQHFINELIDVALHGLTHTRAEVRQMSIALAYNLTLACIKGPWTKQLATEGSAIQDLNPQALQLLCGCFEGILDEKDGLVRRRRLSVICQIARVFKTAATSLIRDLGFEEVLQSIKIDSSTGSLSPALTKEEAKILDELLFYLK